MSLLSLSKASIQPRTVTFNRSCCHPFGWRKDGNRFFSCRKKKETSPQCHRAPWAATSLSLKKEQARHACTYVPAAVSEYKACSCSSQPRSANLQVWLVPASQQQMNSTAGAARARKRGPSRTEQLDELRRTELAAPQSSQMKPKPSRTGSDTKIRRTRSEDFKPPRIGGSDRFHFRHLVILARKSETRQQPPAFFNSCPSRALVTHVRQGVSRLYDPVHCRFIAQKTTIFM